MNKRLAVTVIVGLCVHGAAQAAPVSGQGTWETTLKARDASGNSVALLDPGAVFIYDSALNVTWLANGNAGAGSTHDNGSSTTDGRMTWANAVGWADGLSFTVGGTTYADWRLPVTRPVYGLSFNYAWSNNGSTDHGFNISAPGSAYPGTTASELAYMFYNTLGNKGYCNTSGSCPQSGWGLTNAGPFSGLQSDKYWSGTESGPSNAWDFYFTSSGSHSGSQGVGSRDYEYYAWAVHPGDVAAVPLPAGLPLFLTALASFGLLGARRRGAAG